MKLVNVQATINSDCISSLAMQCAPIVQTAVHSGSTLKTNFIQEVILRILHGNTCSLQLSLTGHSEQCNVYSYAIG